MMLLIIRARILLEMPHEFLRIDSCLPEDRTERALCDLLMGSRDNAYTSTISSSIGGGMGSPRASRLSTYAAIASRTLASASSRVAPWSRSVTGDPEGSSRLPSPADMHHAPPR